MANNSEKKRKKANATFILWFRLVFLISNTICYKMIMMSLDTMVYSEVVKGYSFDIFGLVVFVQVFSAFTDWAWLSLLVIPIGIATWGGRMLLNWVFTPTEGELAETAEIQSRMNRKERRSANRRR
eukprot:g605.t1